MPLIEEIVAALEGVGASREVERGADGANTTQCFRDRGAILARHLGHEISTHGVANEEDLFESAGVGELFENRAIIRAHPRVV